MTMYRIVRKFYRTKKDIETGNFIKTHVHEFDPLTRREAVIVKAKLATPDNAIDHIEAIQ